MAGLLFCALAWSGNTLVARGVVGMMPPVSLAFWRWVLVLVLLLPFAASGLWRHRQALWQCRWQLLVLSALGITAFNTLLYLAARNTTAINISLINTGLPVAVFIAMVVFLRRWPGRRMMYGAALSFLGLIVILTGGSVQQLLTVGFNRGDLLVLLAVMSWGGYSVLLQKWPLPGPGYVQLAALVVCGVPLLLPVYLWEVASSGWVEIGWEVVGAVSYTAVASSLMAHLAWTHGIKVVGPATASMFTYLIPVFTAVFGILMLGEELYWYHLLGGGLALSGIMLAAGK
ncbi:DMT family transporter [Halopseudomonas xiamenensis]|uniref:DMT family transporter n=1 Tax=Halopseudomonas xiamenensis TaxID=157792 RepID=UPI00162611D3|nr:DMT family transporter [Halopseudomonas xiamenensis]